MSTIFSKVLSGEIPSHKVWEDDAHYAFLDIRPVQPGHTLVISKREVDYVFDLGPEAYTALWKAARTVAARLKERLGCERVVIMVIGWEVRHVHVHLIPTNSITDVPMPPAADVSAEEMAEIAARFAD